MRLSGKFHAATALTPQKRKNPPSPPVGQSRSGLGDKRRFQLCLEVTLDSPSSKSQSATVLTVPQRCPKKFWSKSLDDLRQQSGHNGIVSAVWCSTGQPWAQQVHALWLSVVSIIWWDTKTLQRALTWPVHFWLPKGPATKTKRTVKLKLGSTA